MLNNHKNVNFVFCAPKKGGGGQAGWSKIADLATTITALQTTSNEHETEQNQKPVQCASIHCDPLL